MTRRGLKERRRGLGERLRANREGLTDRDRAGLKERRPGLKDLVGLRPLVGVD